MATPKARHPEPPHQAQHASMQQAGTGRATDPAPVTDDSPAAPFSWRIDTTIPAGQTYVAAYMQQSQCIYAIMPAMRTLVGSDTCCIHGCARRGRLCTLCWDISPALATGLCCHREQRYRCRQCKGAGWCEAHGRRRERCIECGPGTAVGICPHGRRRDGCRECERPRTAPSCPPVRNKMTPADCEDNDSAVTPIAREGPARRGRRNHQMPAAQGAQTRTATRLLAEGPCQGTRLRRKSRPARGDPRREFGAHAPSHARPRPRTKPGEKLGTSGCGDPLCKCDVDREGYELKDLPMMTKQAFVTAVRRDMKDEEWRLLNCE